MVDDINPALPYIMTLDYGNYGIPYYGYCKIYITNRSVVDEGRGFK